MSLKEGDWTKIGVVYYNEDKQSFVYKEFDVVCHIIKDALYYDFREQQFGRYSIKHVNLYKILKPMDDTSQWIYTFCEIGENAMEKAINILFQAIDAKKESLESLISYFNNIQHKEIIEET